MRRGRPPAPPANSDDEDSPPAIPERRYKNRVGSLEEKEKKRAAKAEQKSRRDTIGYADIDAANVVHDVHNQNHTQIKTNYAQLAYPPPNNDLEANTGEGSTASGIMFAEIESDEATPYDFPLPVLSEKGHSQDKQWTKENGLECGTGSLEPVADPFADDPFQSCAKAKSNQFKNDFVQGPLVVALPPARSQSCNTGAPRRPQLDKNKRPSSARTFAKAKSTDDVLDDPTYSNAYSRTAVNSNDLGTNRNNCSSTDLPRNKISRPALLSRNSWAGAEAKSYSNPTYGAEPFDPSKLEGHSDGHRPPPRFPDDDPNDDAMQFYEEDFTILQAQGYTRDEITRALIVAENNFAMARKILREFSQGTRKL